MGHIINLKIPTVNRLLSESIWTIDLVCKDSVNKTDIVVFGKNSMITSSHIAFLLKLGPQERKAYLNSLT